MVAVVLLKVEARRDDRMQLHLAGKKAHGAIKVIEHIALRVYTVVFVSEKKQQQKRTKNSL